MRNNQEIPTKFAEPLLLLLAVISGIACVKSDEHWIVTITLVALFLLGARRARKMREKAKALEINSREKNSNDG